MLLSWTVTKLLIILTISNVFHVPPMNTLMWRLSNVCNVLVLMSLTPPTIYVRLHLLLLRTWMLLILSIWQIRPKNKRILMKCWSRITNPKFVISQLLTIMAPNVSHARLQTFSSITLPRLVSAAPQTPTLVMANASNHPSSPMCLPLLPPTTISKPHQMPPSTISTRQSNLTQQTGSPIANAPQTHPCTTPPQNPVNPHAQSAATSIWQPENA